MNEKLLDPLDLPVIKDRVRKREAIKGPRTGDWVIMPDRSMRRLTSGGIGETKSYAGFKKPQPIDAVPDRNPDWISYPSFATSSVFEGKHGSFYLLRDGTISFSGGNNFHNVSRRTKLADTGQTKSGEFAVCEMNTFILGRRSVSFELPCRVYRVSETGTG